MKKSSFGFEKPEDSLGFLLWQTTMTWQRLIKKTLEAYEITHPQFVIMAVLLWFEEQNMTATQVMVARKSNLDKMTVSTSIRSLVTKGFLIRTEHETDTRAKTVKLTKKGKALVSKLVPTVEGMDTIFFGSLSDKDQGKLLQIFNILHDRVDHD